SVVRVALEMVDKFGYSLDALRNSLQDLLRRGRLAPEAAASLGNELAEEGSVPSLGALPSARELVQAFAARVRELGEVPVIAEPHGPAAVDYLAALEVDLPRKGKKRTDIAPPV